MIVPRVRRERQQCTPLAPREVLARTDQHTRQRVFPQIHDKRPMFEQIKPAPRDAILGLTESFREDPNPKKINLSVGVYQDGTGKTPIFDSIHRAGKLVLERQKSMSYLPIDGSRAYAAAVQ